MKTENWNNSNKSIRSHLKFLTTIEALEKFPINPTDNVLELSLGDNDFSDELVKHASENAITHVNINAKNLTIFMHAIEEDQKESGENPFLNKDVDHKNKFDVVFSCWIRHLNKAEINHVFEYIYRALKPCGHTLIITPSIVSSTHITYQKVIDSGTIPELDNIPMSMRKEVHKEIKACLSKLAFSKSEIIMMPHRILLPSLDMFRQFLHEIAFFYKPVMPTELSNEVIDMQVNFFDEYCQEKFDGKYYFEHEPSLIRVVK